MDVVADEVPDATPLEVRPVQEEVVAGPSGPTGRPTRPEVGPTPTCGPVRLPTTTARRHSRFRRFRIMEGGGDGVC